MNEFFYALAIFISFIAGAFVSRWIFRINDIVRELNIQRLLLQKMAEKQGVSKEDIDFAIGKE